ncbi:nucleoside kinase [bacterium]|nr:nucleoside kinase [bacterium]
MPLIAETGAELGPDSSQQDYFKAAAQKGIVGAVVDHQVVNLTHRVVCSCVAKPILKDNYFGRHIITRSASALLFAAAKAVDPNMRLEVGQSLHSQLFFEVKGGGDTVALGEKLNEQYQQMIFQCVPMVTHAISAAAALRMVEDPEGDRRQLMHGWVGDSFGTVTIGDYTDLAYGPFVPNAGFLKGIKIVGIPEGILITEEGKELPAKELKDFMLGAAKQARTWNKRMSVGTVGKLNKVILDGGGQDLVQVSETLQEICIAQIASEIIKRETVKVVFVSGPSSSGKTSTVRRLSTHLKAMGKETIYVGLDDYYIPAEQCPKDENGEYDFEALEALDVERIKRDLRSLVEGKVTSIPHYDFVTQRPVPKEQETEMQIGEDQILLIEGIHGLNPAITGAVDKANAYSVFVSALPQVNLDFGARVPTTYARLLRRIIRDRRYRGVSAESTIKRWPSVRKGENKYIFPYQHLADAMFNSALPYELAVFRVFGWQYLMEVNEDSPAYLMARDMLRFLSLVVPMSDEWIPKNSVLREFLGGSIYKY